MHDSMNNVLDTAIVVLFHAYQLWAGADAGRTPWEEYHL